MNIKSILPFGLAAVPVSLTGCSAVDDCDSSVVKKRAFQIIEQDREKAWESTRRQVESAKTELAEGGPARARLQKSRGEIETKWLEAWGYIPEPEQREYRSLLDDLENRNWQAVGAEISKTRRLLIKLMEKE
ncbi:hypothetical protein [Candidatus Spongiihabitans sp.]|uniref:hypothetical protein n=1 Tax=Candidatus Spongiihabitans sp. TaxID=3101308 RepID=UPI003C6FB246